jgi:hypothetical protein
MTAKRSGRSRKVNSARRKKETGNKQSELPRLYLPSGSVEFPQARGKTLAQVYLTTDPECRQVTLTFDDKTELVVDIEPCVSFAADYSSWKTGNQRVIRRWRRISYPADSRPR